jgi:hypothetical protein
MRMWLMSLIIEENPFIRCAVCRCFLGTSKSASSQPRIVSFHGPNTTAARCGVLRCGGVASPIA